MLARDHINPIGSIRTKNEDPVASGVLSGRPYGPTNRNSGLWAPNQTGAQTTSRAQLGLGSPWGRLRDRVSDAMSPPTVADKRHKLTRPPTGVGTGRCPTGDP
jgi:hypothetical protein